MFFDGCGCAGGRGEQVYRTFKATTYKIQADDDQDLSEHCALDYAQLNDLRRILSYWAVMGYMTDTPNSIITSCCASDGIFQYFLRLY
jgi:hypothetical protein